jgi:hypothetical protein
MRLIFILASLLLPDQVATHNTPFIRGSNKTDVTATPTTKDYDGRPTEQNFRTSKNIQGNHNQQTKQNHKKRHISNN